jgi:hypothetical protein
MLYTGSSVSENPVCRKPTFRNLGWVRVPPPAQPQKLTADRPYEVYPALLGSCLTTLTGTLTGTGYRRNTPYPAKHL